MCPMSPSLQKFYLRCLKQQNNTACAKDQRCEITKDTRSQCQYCRLQKCFQLRMYKPGTVPCGVAACEHRLWRAHDEVRAFQAWFCLLSPLLPLPVCWCYILTRLSVPWKKYHLYNYCEIYSYKQLRDSCTIGRTWQSAVESDCKILSV